MRQWDSSQTCVEDRSPQNLVRQPCIALMRALTEELHRRLLLRRS